MKLKIRDDSLTGKTLHEFEIEIDETVDVREIIRSRVFQEVKDYNAGRSKSFHGLVLPQGCVPHEGTTKPPKRKIDWEKQFALALEAYTAGRVLVLVDDRQTESLDEEFALTTETSVSFLKLVPLVGG